MLVDLTVRNLALIEEARLSFGSGLNAITGETGAGKSLIVTGLELLLGERPKGGAAGWVRAGAERAEVEGRFAVPPGPIARRIDAFIEAELPSFVAEWREEHGPVQGAARAAGPRERAESCGATGGDALGADSLDGSSTGYEAERELLLARTLEANGRTRAWVNHRPVTRRALGELASMLVEIHGQNTHQRLLTTEHQLELLDASVEASVSRKPSSGGRRSAGSGRKSAAAPAADFGPGSNCRGNRSAHAAYDRARRHWIALADDVDDRVSRRRDRRERLEFLRFQVAELESLAPASGELDRLRAERSRLRHAGGLERDLRLWLDVLSEGEGPALDRLRGAARSVGDWSLKVGELDTAAEELSAAQIHLEEATALLVSFADSVEVDPRRLEQVEERLDELERLAAKHGDEPDALPSRLDTLAGEVRELEESEEGLEDLIRERDGALAEVERAAARLSRARRRRAPHLSAAVRASLVSLGLGDAEFEIRIESVAGGSVADGAADGGQAGGGKSGSGESGSRDSGAAETEGGRPLAVGGSKAAGRGAAAGGGDDPRLRFGPTGADRVEFLLAANAGEPPRPLRHVASGGEAARIMLALRTAVVGCEESRCLVFDEIDTGVGGRLGPELGSHMRSLGEHHQVLSVTHLPAIAASGHRHLVVRKAVRRGRTRTSVALIEGAARVEEVADMIAGGAEQATAQAEARRLLEAVAV